MVSDSLGKPVCTPTSFSKFLVCLVLGTVACMGARTTNTACSAALLAPKLALFRALCRFQKNNGPKTAHLANRSVWSRARAVEVHLLILYYDGEYILYCALLCSALTTQNMQNICCMSLLIIRCVYDRALYMSVVSLYSVFVGVQKPAYFARCLRTQQGCLRYCTQATWRRPAKPTIHLWGSFNFLCDAIHTTPLISCLPLLHTFKERKDIEKTYKRHRKDIKRQYGVV